MVNQISLFIPKLVLQLFVHRSFPVHHFVAISIISIAN